MDDDYEEYDSFYKDVPLKKYNNRKKKDKPQPMDYKLDVDKDRELTIYTYGKKYIKTIPDKSQQNFNAEVIMF